MKIAWFTPFAKGSPVAAFSARVVAGLQAIGYDPVLVRLDDMALPNHAYDGAVQSWRKWNELSEIDVSIYVAGNSFVEFAPIFDLLGRQRGIVIFHDDSLDRYFEEYFAAIGPSAMQADGQSPVARLASRASAAITATPKLTATLKAIGPAPVLQCQLPRNARDARLYAEAVAAFCAEVLTLEPLLNLSKIIGDRLRTVGALPDDALVRRTITAAETLFPRSLQASSKADPA